MRKLFQISFVLVGIIIVLTACDQLFFGTPLLHSSSNTGSPSEPTVAASTEVNDLESFLAALRAAGANVEAVGLITQPFFPVEGQAIQVNGADVQVFEFPTETDARSAASQISPDGGSAGTTMINWMATPHFYQAGKLIVLYVGDDSSITTLLTSVLNAQFAGR